MCLIKVDWFYYTLFIQSITQFHAICSILFYLMIKSTLFSLHFFTQRLDLRCLLCSFSITDQIYVVYYVLLCSQIRSTLSTMLFSTQTATVLLFIRRSDPYCLFCVSLLIQYIQIVYSALLHSKIRSTLSTQSLSRRRSDSYCLFSFFLLIE